MWRGTQVVRERSAKPLCAGSIPARASKNPSEQNADASPANAVLGAFGPVHPVGTSVPAPQGSFSYAVQLLRIETAVPNRAPLPDLL